jgi:hypothetical protein
MIEVIDYLVILQVELNYIDEQIFLKNYSNCFLY